MPFDMLSSLSRGTGIATSHSPQVMEPLNFMGAKGDSLHAHCIATSDVVPICHILRKHSHAVLNTEFEKLYSIVFDYVHFV